MLVGDEGEERDSLYVCTCAPMSTPVGRSGGGGETGSQVAKEGGLSVAESCA